MPKILLNWTALYERLSRDDERYGDSVSIEHQKTYLEKYAVEHGLTQIHHYTDDGWTGGNFDRPGWSRLIADVEEGKIGTIIVKDMSRVGRDHVQTGFYTEIYFGQKNVHFIAVDSRVDNMSRDSNEFAPLLNVFNEYYLHDLSRKCKIGFRARGMSGKPLIGIPCFGYIKDPADHNHWIVEPEAAETVRRIFQLAAEGGNPNSIAKTLCAEERKTPGEYFAQRGIKARSYGRRADIGPYAWSRQSVAHLIRHQEYLGHTVNFKTGKASYKSKQKMLPESERRIFENTHEAIVDQTTWDKAQLALVNQRKEKADATPNPFGKRIICAKCGAPMYDIHYDQLTQAGNVCHEEFMMCSTFHNTNRTHQPHCVKNTLSTRQLRALLSQAVHLVSQYAVTD